MLKKSPFKFGLMAAGILSATVLPAEEITSTLADQSTLNVTIYNSNIALIKDNRQINLPKGQSTVAFRDVSAAIRPETAIVKSDKLSVLEQNFEYDLLSEQALLNKYIGKTVTVLTRNPATGEQSKQQATVLSTHQGVMLKLGDSIRSLSSDMSVIYDKLPKNLRDKPTLTLRIDSQSAGAQPVELTYLSDQLNWKADYVANLITADTLNLKGWVTLSNNSGTDYPNAKLQLVAGKLNRVQQPQPRAMAMEMTMRKDAALASPNMAEESLFEYHLYTLGHPTTIKNKQQKQVSLLAASNVPYEKRLIIEGSDPYGRSNWGKNAEYQSLETQVKVIIDNNKNNALGMPIPAGVIRTYQNDSKGNSQFIGEDSIKHTPENERIALLLGKAFDVTAKRKQTDFRQERSKKQNAVSKTYQHVVTASYKVVFKNAKDHDVKVEYLDRFSGQWSINEQSLNSEKLNSTSNRWLINIPAKGETQLTYTVTMVY